MKSTAILCCVLLATVAFAVESNKLRKSGFNVQKELAHLKNTEFGQHILKTLELQVGSGGATDDAITLLNGVRLNLETQRDQEAADYSQESTSLGDEIEELTARAQHALSEVTEASQLIGQLTPEKARLADEVERLTEQIEAVREQKQNLEDLRHQDEQDAIATIAQSREIVTLLTDIISQLDDLYNRRAEPTMLEKKAIIKRLKTTKYSEPISAFVELSSTFDRKVIKNVIVRIEDVLRKVNQYIEDEQNAETASVLKYNDLHQQLEEILDGYVYAQVEAQRDYQQTSNELVNQINRRDNNQDVYDAAERERLEKEEQLQTITDVFNTRQAQLNEEIELLNQAVNIFTANAERFRRLD